ncbi:hypothetical protein AQAU111925_03470 [Aquirufa aurantiipilula]
MQNIENESHVKDLSNFQNLTNLNHLESFYTLFIVEEKQSLIR